ncbi:MAG: hypothetical protein HOP10_03445 [Chitinophagaceae bacterium]|nr:hypothetical protein [Chitinophagaceae bacterium]
MKKYIVRLLLITAMFTVACNNKKGKATEEKKDTATKATTIGKQDFCKLTPLPYEVRCSNAGGVIIDPDVAQQYIADFRTRYPALESSYWISGCVIDALYIFFNDNANASYDGLWLTFGARELEPHQSTLSLVPSIYDNGKHVSQWEAVSKIRLPGSCNGSEFLTTNSEGAQRFRDIHRRENTTGVIRGLTRKVWIDECVINMLKALIDMYSRSDTPLNGLYIYSSAYYKTLPAEEQPKGYDPTTVQSSVVLVLSYTCKNDNKTYPAWEINRFLYELNKEKNKDVFNHGELCPTSCLNSDD